LLHLISVIAISRRCGSAVRCYRWQLTSRRATLWGQYRCWRSIDQSVGRLSIAESPYVTAQVTEVFNIFIYGYYCCIILLAIGDALHTRLHKISLNVDNSLIIIW